MLKIINLAKFGSNPLRIDWFGHVTTAGRDGGKIPRIQLTVSQRIRSDRLRAEATVAASFLPIIRIGDIWSGGVRVGPEVTSTRETFAGLSISRSTVEVCPIGVPLGSDGSRSYALPFEAFDGHRSHTGAQCARVKVSDDVILIIPCMELIRFYFGTDGRFVSRLLSGAQALDNVFTKPKIGFTTGAASIELGEDIHGSAAPTVARIAFDPRADLAARMILNSGVLASVNRQPYYPRTSFPFEGITDLTADGVWIGTGAPNVFLAERLVQCTHAFPFSRLTYKLYPGAKSGNPGQGQGATRQMASRSKRPANDAPAKESYVSPTLAEVSIALTGDDLKPFPDLDGKPIRQAGGRSSDAARVAKTDESLEFAAGEKRSSGTDRGIHLSRTDGGKVHQGLETSSGKGLTINHGATGAFSRAFQSFAGSGKTDAALIPVPFDDDPIWATGPFTWTERTQWKDLITQGMWLAGIRFLRGKRANDLLVLIKDVAYADSSPMVALVRFNNVTTEKIAPLAIRAACFSNDKLMEFHGEEVVRMLTAQQCEDETEIARVLEEVLVAGSNLEAGGNKSRR
jgi:hypothetical protein